MNVPNILWMKYLTSTARFLISLSAFLQISPPGLDESQIATWGAVGFSQKLTPKWTLTAYLGGAREWSGSLAPVAKPGIAVYNQEFLYQFNPKWQASIASSIRHQNKYEEEPPYDARDESYRWELRYYGRLYYKQQLEQLALTYAFRPEFRTFYSPDWKPASTPFELRLRLKAQATLPLNQKKTNFLVGGNEFLSAEDEYRINTQRTVNTSGLTIILPRIVFLSSFVTFFWNRLLLWILVWWSSLSQEVILILFLISLSIYWFLIHSLKNIKKSGKGFSHGRKKSDFIWVHFAEHLNSENVIPVCFAEIMLHQVLTIGVPRHEPLQIVLITVYNGKFG